MTVAPPGRSLRFRDFADVVNAIRRDGGRLTMPRRLVLEALFAADRLVSAEQIADGADTGVEIELTSVYRNLEWLEALGVVRHVHFGHRAGLYGLVGEGEREYLVCEACGRVTAARPGQLDDARESIRAQFGYEAHFTHFPIHGLCSECATAPGSR
jgi:Fur family transcriptional regulator, ferric uptake regulator